MTCPFPMQLSSADFKAIRAKAKARRLQRIDRIADNLALLGRKASQAAQAAPRRAKRSYRRKSSRKRLIAKLDALFSLFIRMRGKRRTGGMCELCGKRPIEVCFHWISRGDYATRWDLKNCVASCAGCNYRETFQKRFYRDLHISRVGLEEREALEAKARTLTHFTDADLVLLMENLKQAMETWAEAK